MSSAPTPRSTRFATCSGVIDTGPASRSIASPSCLESACAPRHYPACARSNPEVAPVKPGTPRSPADGSRTSGACHRVPCAVPLGSVVPMWRHRNSRAEGELPGASTAKRLADAPPALQVWFAKGSAGDVAGGGLASAAAAPSEVSRGAGTHGLSRPGLRVTSAPPLAARPLLARASPGGRGTRPGRLPNAEDRVPVCLVEGDDASAAVESALQMVSVGLEPLGAKPVNEFDNGGVPVQGIPASHIWRPFPVSRSIGLPRGAGAMGSRSRSAVRSGRLSCSARGSRPRHEPIPRRHGRSTPYRDRRVQGDRHAALVSARSAAADVRGLRMNTAVQAGFRCCRTLRDGLTRRVATARPRPRERTAS